MLRIFIRNQCWIFVKCFFSTYWEACIIFLFYSVNMVNSIDCFSNIKWTLPFGGKILLIIYSLLHILICLWGYWTVVFFSYNVWLWYQVKADSDELGSMPNSIGNQPWIVIGTDAEAPKLWPPNAKNTLIGIDPDAGKDWRQEEKGPTEDEMVGWHHWLDGHEFEQAPGDGEGQGGLACCSPWGCKESAMTERLNWLTEAELVLHLP